MKKKEREGGREEGRKGRRKKEKAQTEELNGHFCLYYQLCSVKAAEEGGSIPPVSKQQSSPAIYPNMVLHSSFSHIKALPLIPPPN